MRCKTDGGRYGDAPRTRPAPKTPPPPKPVSGLAEYRPEGGVRAQGGGRLSVREKSTCQRNPCVCHPLRPPHTTLPSCQQGVLLRRLLLGRPCVWLPIRRAALEGVRRRWLHRLALVARRTAAHEMCVCVSGFATAVTSVSNRPCSTGVEAAPPFAATTSATGKTASALLRLLH